MRGGALSSEAGLAGTFAVALAAAASARWRTSGTPCLLRQYAIAPAKGRLTSRSARIDPDRNPAPMRRTRLTRSAFLTLLAVVAGLPIAAQAGGLPTDEPALVDQTTYVERSLNRHGPLTIEHAPMPRHLDHTRDGDPAAIAGFCRSGGYVRRRTLAGEPVLLRQREVCDSVAPRTLAPGEVDPRPAWPREVVRVLRSKG